MKGVTIIDRAVPEGLLLSVTIALAYSVSKIQYQILHHVKLMLMQLTLLVITQEHQIFCKQLHNGFKNILILLKKLIQLLKYHNNLLKLYLNQMKSFYNQSTIDRHINRWTYICIIIGTINKNSKINQSFQIKIQLFEDLLKEQQELFQHNILVVQNLKHKVKQKGFLNVKINEYQNDKHLILIAIASIIKNDQNLFIRQQQQ